MKIHFEIGHIHSINQEDGTEETESVFSADSLSECLAEFKTKGYTEPEYFIDVWETRCGDIPYPVADVKVN